MQKVTTTCVVVMAAVVLATAAACDNRECDDKFDCALGQFCSVDGTCTSDESQIIAGNTAVFLRTQDGRETAVVDVTQQQRDMPATLDGNISSAQSTGRARGQVSMWEPGRIDLIVTHPTLNSTFIALFHIPTEVLERPGDHAIGAPTDVTSTVAQACNHDTTHYDEQVSDVVLHVPEPVDGAPSLPVGIEFHSPSTDATATAEVPLLW